MQTTQLCFVGKEAATKGVSRGVDPDELKERRRYKKKKRKKKKKKKRRVSMHYA